MAQPLDHPLLSQRYFFPSDDGPQEPTIVRVDGATLHCAFEQPHPGGHTVVFFHGNGEVVADYQPWLGRALAQRGLNLLLMEYRGYGGSSGRPSLVDMLADGAQVGGALGLDPAQTIAFGRSVGSIYALEWVARLPTTRALVLESGVADVLERVLLRVEPSELDATLEQLEAEAARRLDHRKKLEQYPGPLLVLHAAHDTVVSRTHGERLASWGHQGRTQLRLLPDGDHNSVMRANWGEYWAAFDQFLATVA